MSVGQTVLVVYALLMLGGGIAGYRKARSVASLVAGTASAGALGAAWWWSRSRPVAGLTLGAIVAAVLAAFFLHRLVKTGKPMPAGGLFAVSLAVAVALALLAR